MASLCHPFLFRIPTKTSETLSLGQNRLGKASFPFSFIVPVRGDVPDSIVPSEDNENFSNDVVEKHQFVAPQILG
jgi:hypothetical protein